MKHGFINPSLGASPRLTAIFAGDGSAAAPSFAFTNDPDTGIYRGGANDLRFVTGGVVALSLSALQNATFAGNVVTGASGIFGVSGRLLITSPADGVMLIRNNAATDFSRLQFGGTTNSFPSIKRSGAVLDVKLADDSGFCGLRAEYFRIQTTDAYIRAGTGSPEGVLTAGIGSIYQRIDGGAGTSLYVKESGTGNTGWVAK